MRLICPNCSAQYEIDVTLIPDEGRDVQCSNCGHTWFELPPAAQADGIGGADDAPEPEDFDTPEADPEPESQSSAAKAIAAATEDIAEENGAERVASEPFKGTEDPFAAAASEFLPSAASNNDDHDAEDDDADSTGEDNDDEDNIPDVDLSAIAPTTLKARRPSDAADVDLLREEADLELSRRAKPSEAFEAQTDLGLEDLTNRKTPSRALRARMARSTGSETSFEDTEPASEADYQAPQRDLLPDIDEINSTLNQNTDTVTGQTVSGRSGFRIGFGLIVLVCVAAILAYAFAPALANAIPDAENALLRFVDLANQLRDWIDGLMA